MTDTSSTPLADIDLRPLAEMEAAERAFLSCYLTGDTGAESLKNRVARVRRLLSKTPAELDHFEASLALLEQWLADNPPGDGTVAVFTCGVGGLVRRRAGRRTEAVGADSRRGLRAGPRSARRHRGAGSPEAGAGGYRAGRSRQRREGHTMSRVCTRRARHT